MNQRKLVAFVLTSILFLPLLSCGGHDADEKYFLISANIKIPYWEMAGAGLSQAASDLKVRSKFDGPDGYDPKAEQEALQKAIQQKATGILISVVDPALMKDDIDRAIAAGIPVITVDSDAPSSKRLFFIGTNNYQAGLNGGQRLAKELNGKGNVAVFTVPSYGNMNERLRGYRHGHRSGHAGVDPKGRDHRRHFSKTVHHELCGTENVRRFVPPQARQFER